MIAYAEQNRKLYRSRRQKVFAGICGGFAEYFHIDVTLVRILMLLAAFLNGAGVIVYVVCLILMKENPEQHLPIEPVETQSFHSTKIAGAFLIFLGAVLLLHNLTGMDWWLPWRWHNLIHFHLHDLLPLFLIAVGVAIFWQSYRQPGQESVPGTAAVPQLKRCRTDRMIGGVCIGMAHYWRIDVTLIRILWVLIGLVLNVPFVVLVYIALMVILPEEMI